MTTATLEDLLGPLPDNGVEATTPAGFHIRYEWEPKRRYLLDGAEVPSVTTILDALDKPALTWWGMKVGVEGVCQLVREPVNADEDQAIHHALTEGDVGWIVDTLTAHKLTVNHQRDKAADRGLSVHKAFEEWARDGYLRPVEQFPDTERGYVQGLYAFLADARHLEPVLAEVMVASREYGFAGRYDLMARFTGPTELVTHLTPKKETRAEFAPGRYLIDLKTSSRVYESHHLQLAGYEGASVESGYPPSDYRAVLRVTSDGRYELVPCKAEFRHFLGVKAAFDAVNEVKAA